MQRRFTTFFLYLALLPKAASAHCPLCTAGAGALAVLAASLGVSAVIVGVLIGAFALALSIWIAGLIKETYIPYQKQIVASVIFLSTVIPIMPFVRAYGPWYLSFWGEYGTLFHNTYTINLYVLGVVVGALIMLAVPHLSKMLTKMRGSLIPFQGMLITFVLLTITSLIIQFVAWQ